MTDTYYLYSIRLQGWLTKNGTATSQRDKAGQFNYADAIAWCKRHKDHNDAATCFPVHANVLTEIEQ